MKEEESAMKPTSPAELNPEQIARLKAQAAEAIQMKADIKTVIAVFGDVMKSFGLQDVEISGGSNNIQALLPAIVGKLSREMMMGTFNTQALANIQAVMPIIEKYKHLADE